MLLSSSLQTGEPPQVKVAASIFGKIVYNNKDNLLAGIICAGWDKYHGGSVYTISLGGAVVEQPFAIGGKTLNFILFYFLINFFFFL
jgi:20S proteasome subunit beta 1